MSDEKDKRVSVEPYKGVRDFYPDGKAIQNYIFKVMGESAELFGYRKYDASILEPTDLYTGKTSDEIVNEQTYTFEDRGGRSVTLRPEMTPSVARMVAKKLGELPRPIRWYSIPNVFRYERPQKGRLREHWQLNVDVFGIEDSSAEIEIISIASTILNRFGLTKDQFEIRVNDRAAMNAFFANAGLDEEKTKEAVRLLDKKDKVDDFDEKMTELAGSSVDFESLDSENARELIEKLKEIGITNVVYDKTLARGFDYYTGIVFEVFDTGGENNRSLFGGGRYDNLLDMFGVERIPAVGFGMGDVTMRDVLRSYDLLPGIDGSAEAYICVLGKEQYSYALRIARMLREEGIRTIVDYSYASIGAQIKKALREGAKVALIVGIEEMKNDTVTVKNLEAESEDTLAVGEVVEKVRDIAK